MSKNQRKNQRVKESDKDSKDSIVSEDEHVERICTGHLRNNPDFFMRHPDLLQSMELRHGTDTVPSLLDKRMELLRKSNRELEAKARSLLATAAHNEKLSLCVYKLGRDLIRHCRRDGNLSDAACCELIHKHFPDLGVDILPFGEGENDASVRQIKSNDQRIAGLLESLFGKRQLSCGPFNPAEKVALFGADAMQVASALVAPLGGYTNRARYGLLILTSPDPEKFMPGLGTMFLVQMVGVIETALGVDCDDL